MSTVNVTLSVTVTPEYAPVVTTRFAAALSALLNDDHLDLTDLRLTVTVYDTPADDEDPDEDADA